jgi:hypothetical protein
MNTGPEPQRMSDRQLKHITRDVEDGCYDYSYDGGQALKALLAEAVRARAVEEKVGAIVAVTDLLAENDAASRARPMAEQLDYLSASLAAILDPEQIPRETLLAIGAHVMRLGVLVTEARTQATYLKAARDGNLAMHFEIERVRQEVGGTRTTRREWRVKIPGRAPVYFGEDEDRARAWVGHRDLMGAEQATLQDRLTFLGDWRDAPPKTEVASNQEPAPGR